MQCTLGERVMIKIVMGLWVLGIVEIALAIEEGGHGR